MKRFIYVFFLLFVMVLSACSNDEGKESEKKEEDQKVDVDKGLLNVEVTLPSTMFEGEDIDEVMADAKEEGVSEVTKNDDGSITFKMTKSKHKEMMEDIKGEVTQTVTDTKNSEDYVSIKDITYNDSFSEFTMVVDKASYENSMDGFAVFGLGISGMMYQLFAGVDSDKTKVTITVKDEATDEVINEMIYPDDME
ncbi:hypothetical protein WAK64_20480 [Bacillus spongiae]|uniref:Antigen I/II N-terminal domain-containing protein n=1 Tax=Bacillus spongiae TaxID=2683610 RepID=A0ABU8HJ33_9BACI